MNCNQYNDVVAADIDGVLSGEERRSAAEHLAICPRCMAARRDQQVAKSILRERVARHAVPEELRQRVLAAVDAPRETRSAETSSVARRRILIGTIAALLAVALYSLVSPASPDLVAVMVADVNAAEAGELDLGRRTSSVEDLQSYYERSGRIDFEQSAGDFGSKGFRLVGGRIAEIGTLPTTLSVYDSAHGKVVCRRFRDGTIEIPSFGDQIGGRRIFTVDGVTFGITRLEGGVLCILASKMPRETFVQHLEGAHADVAPVAVASAAPLL